MKTKDLIKKLQELDISGEVECCINNEDILCVYTLPAYWDGCLEILSREKDNPYYNINGGLFTKEGKKIMIQPLSIKEAVSNNPYLPVEYCSEYSRQKYEAEIEEERKLTIKDDEDRQLDAFVAWAYRKFMATNFAKVVKAAAMSFFSANKDYFNSYKNLLPDELRKNEELEYLVRRNIQWDREVSFVDGNFVLNKASDLIK